MHVAHCTLEQKPLRVETIRQLAGTEENYRIIIRELDRVKAQLTRAHTFHAAATLTLVDWLLTLERFNWCCAYCQLKPFQVMSHILPLWHGGGTTPENCVPACYRCVARRKRDVLNEPDDLCNTSA